MTDRHKPASHDKAKEKKMQQKPVPTYGITKTQYARKLEEWEANQTTHQPGEGFFARFRKKRG